MTSRTQFLARLLGLYLMLIALAMVEHRPETVQTVGMLLHAPALLFLLGVIVLAAGLAMVLGHNVWSGGPLPVVVTLIGWGTLLKGAVFLFLTPAMVSRVYFETLRYNQLFYVYTVVAFILGVYLTYAGFRPAAR